MEWHVAISLHIDGATFIFAAGEGKAGLLVLVSIPSANPSAVQESETITNFLADSRNVSVVNIGENTTFGATCFVRMDKGSLDGSEKVIFVARSIYLGGFNIQ